MVKNDQRQGLYVTPLNTNMLNLELTQMKSGTSSELNLHDCGFNSC